MKHRIFMWASLGFLVAGFWAFYVSAFFAVYAYPVMSDNPMMPLVEFTCPVVFVSSYFNFPLGVYWAFLANAATYALVGLIVDTLRLQLHHNKINSN